MKNIMEKKMKSNFKYAIIGATSIIALTQMTRSFAEEEKMNNDNIISLEEIFVTAQKRSQSLQDVAMGITAFTGVDLERAGDVSFEDFAVRVPNLTFAASNDGGLRSRSIAIRGIFGIGTTGFYIDDTPMEESMAPVVLDLERVEVLRGPQGTLYGARSMGGTVRFITKQPNLTEIEVKGHVGASNTKEGGLNYLMDAVVNLPVIADKMAIRLVGYYQYEEGIFDREHSDYSPVSPITGLPTTFSTADFASTENIDDYDVRGVQAAVKFLANDWLTLNGRINYQKAGIDGLSLSDNEPGNYVNRRAFNIQERSDDEWYHASVGFEADTGSGALFGSFSRWDRNTRDVEDVSELMSWFGFFAGAPFFVAPVASGSVRDGEVQGNVAEIRFVSDFDSPFQVVVGGFYSDTSVKNDILQRGEGITEIVNTLFGLPLGTDFLGINDTGYSQIYRGDIKEVALFGEASYELTEKLKITAGLRWFETKIDSNGEIGGFVGLDPTSAVEPSFGKNNGFNPKFAAEYSYSDDGMVYASASKGFRRGGVNAAPINFCRDALEDAGFPNPEDGKSFKSDSIWSYEVGAKTTMADNRVQLNGAAYWVDWSDIQQNITLDCGFGFTVNSGTVVSKGFEIETSVAVTEGFVVAASVGYTDAKITESGLSNSPVSVPGTRVQHIPKWTFSATAEYEFAIANGVDGRLRADYSYIGESISFNNHVPGESTPPRTREAINLFDLRATAVLEKWELSIFADNLLNEITTFGDSRSLSVETPNRPRLHQNRPRTLGVEARFSY